jgi:hypothetical protein
VNKNELLAELCWKSLDDKCMRNELTTKRLTEELSEVTKKNDSKYFIELYDKKAKFTNNENNLAIAYLLDLVDHVAWEKGPGYTVPEWP